MKTKRLTWVGGVLIASSVIACGSQPLARRASGGGGNTGTIPDDGTRGTSLIAKGQADSKAGKCDAPTAAAPPLRRLSRIEYNNSVAALFGDTTQPASDFVSEAKVAGYNSNVGIPASDHDVTQYLDAAETIAKNVVGKLTASTGCASTSDTACIDGWITKTGRRAFHGTLPDDEKAQLLNDYHAAAKDLGADAGATFAVEAILTSPRFLFVVEMGQDGQGIVPLTASEIAGRLALSLWRSVPDAALLAAADGGKLDTAEGVAAQARQMLDSRADGVLADFVTQWMEIPSVEALAKDPMSFPTFTPQVRTSIVEETVETFRDVARDPAKGIGDLLGLTYTMANADVAGIYGASSAGTSFAKLTLPATRRGILTQPAVIAAHSHPVQISPTLRGKLVRTKLICEAIAPPPPDANPNLPPQMDGQKTQDVLAMHAKEAKCAACHAYMDPIGYGFNHFDATGKDLGAAAGSDVGEVKSMSAGADDVSGNFTGAVALADMLSKSETVKQCFQIQMLRYAMGREEVTGDACSAAQAWDRFAAGKYNIREAIIAVAGSDTFRYRTSINAGGACQ
jgi:hypothetical protein